jgi:hypothetical protein
MAQTASETLQAPQHSSANHSEAEALREGIDALNKTLQTQQEHLQKQELEEKRRRKEHAGAWAGGAFAALGLKLGFIIGGAWEGHKHPVEFKRTLGIFPIIKKADTSITLDKESVNTTLNKILDVQREQVEHLRDTRTAKEFWTRSASTGAVVGVALAAILGQIGYALGERVDEPKDFIRHPIGSLKKMIFGKDNETPVAPPATSTILKKDSQQPRLEQNQQSPSFQKSDNWQQNLEKEQHIDKSKERSR